MRLFPCTSTPKRTDQLAYLTPERCEIELGKMKLAAAALLVGSAAAYTAPTMTFSLGKKKAASAPAPKVSSSRC